MSADAIYVMEIFLPKNAAKLPCICDSCGWKGRGSKVTDIEECSLVPGDPSPVGRCPKCDNLAYLNREEDRARDRAGKLCEHLELMTATLENVLLHQGRHMTKADRVARIKAVAEALAVIRKVKIA